MSEQDRIPARRRHRRPGPGIRAERVHDRRPPDRRRRTGPRLPQARSDPGGQERHPHLFGGINAVDVEYLEIPRHQDHRADRAERSRQDHSVQPAHRIRHPADRGVAVRRPLTGWSGILQSGPDGHGPHVPADQSHGQADRHRKHAPGGHGAVRREPVQGPLQENLGAARNKKSPSRQRICWTNSSWTPNATTTQPHSPAASANCWKWPGP